jgi:dipeptidyl aminopeptidase/acylaminoacyl peptidase
MRRATLCLSLILTVFLLAAGSPAASAAEVQRVERGNLVLEDIPEVPEGIIQRLRQYQNVRSASLRGWHPSGQGIIILTRFGETTQIHWVAEPGGSRRQITFFHEPIGGATVSPDAERNGFIFSKDVGGSEFYQLFFYDLATGRHRLLTDGKSRNGGAAWANDGKRYALFTTRRNGRDWDIHVGDITKSGDSEPVLERTGTWFPADWSPDDSRLLLIKYVSIQESHPFILDLRTGDLTELHPTEEKIGYGDAAFSGDGKGIYYTSDEGSEFKRLLYYDIESGKSEVLTAEIPWDIDEIELSDTGRHLAYTVNEDGIARLHVRQLPGGRELDLPEIPIGQIYRLEFSPDGERLGMVLNTPQTPGDVYTLELGNRTLTRWTHSEIGGLDGERFVTPELIHYETFDQVDGKPRKIPAFYFKPRGKGPFPVIVSIHGGPEGQALPYFSSSIQSWVNELGIAVIRPNVRGSSGYGKSYLELDNGFKREESVKDIGKLLDWIEGRPDLDADRVAVYGGSYGGYMVLASMVRYGDRLRAGIDIVGISNFVTFLKNTKDYRRDLRRVEYGDERDPEMHDFLNRISPATHASKITKPLFIAQGLNDPRVPVTESEQMVEEIRRNGGSVWYLLAKDEGHGFKKKTNRDYYQAAMMLFLEQFLLGKETASPHG